MPRTITVEGKQVTVPDDATEDEINKLFPPPPPTHQGYVSRVLSDIGGGLSNIYHHPLNSLRDAAGLLPFAPIGGTMAPGGPRIDPRFVDTSTRMDQASPGENAADFTAAGLMAAPAIAGSVLGRLEVGPGRFIQPSSTLGTIADWTLPSKLRSLGKAVLPEIGGEPVPAPAWRRLQFKQPPTNHTPMWEGLVAGDGTGSPLTPLGPSEGLPASALPKLGSNYKPVTGPVRIDPIWLNKTTGESSGGLPQFDPAPAESLPKPGSRVPDYIKNSKPAQTPPATPPIEGEATMIGKGEQLAPIDKFEMNRLAHARAQELELPGSPAGKNGHPQLSTAAQENFAAKSWSDLNVKQMRQVYEFMDQKGRLPKKGELPKL